MAQRVTPAQIAAAARARGLDPQAVLAVARQEGLGGGIGDGGHAYGPFQLNNAGGVISQMYGGRVNDPTVQDWAWSPQGVGFALDRMAGVARGQRGQTAISSIVNRFERPANPGREIAGALGAYGSAPAGATGSPSAAVPQLAAAAAPQPAPDFRPQLASQLAAAAGTPTNDLSGFYSTLTQALRARETAQQPQTSQAGPLAMRPPEPTPGVGLGRVTGATGGENPAFLNDLARLAAFEHAPVAINSGYRSQQQQQQLWDNRASNPNPVARPGTSLHQQGLAADGTIGGRPLGTLPPALLRRFGLMPVPGDPVHVQILR